MRSSWIVLAVILAWAVPATAQSTLNAAPMVEARIRGLAATEAQTADRFWLDTVAGRVRATSVRRVADNEVLVQFASSTLPWDGGSHVVAVGLGDRWVTAPFTMRLDRPLPPPRDRALPLEILGAGLACLLAGCVAWRRGRRHTSIPLAKARPA